LEDSGCEKAYDQRDIVEDHKRPKSDNKEIRQLGEDAVKLAAECEAAMPAASSQQRYS
jgi:hypothetical protein